MNPVKRYLTSLEKHNRSKEVFSTSELRLYADLFNNFKMMYALLDVVKHEQFPEMTYELWAMLVGDQQLEFLRKQKTMLNVFSAPMKKVVQWIVTVSLVGDPRISVHLKTLIHRPSDAELDNLLKSKELYVTLIKYHK